MNFSERITTNRLYYNHTAILIVGCLVGIMAAYFISGIPFEFSHELSEAKRLGIVSKTILAGYPKSRDIVLYAAVIILPVFCSLCAWLVWSRGRRLELTALFRDETAPATVQLRKQWFTVLSVALVYVLITFNINRFYAPFKPGALGEEGQHLAWAHIILGGGVYARDFFCLYGPLLIYPQTWFMKLFGTSIIVQRAYTYVLFLIGYTIIIIFFQQTIRNRGVFIFAAFFSLATFAWCGDPLSPNSSFPRVALGFVPLLILYHFAEKDRNLPIVMSGLAIGFSLIFSQEVGFCAIIASSLFLCLKLRITSDYRRLAREGLLMAAGCLMVIVPVLAYFNHQDALGRLFDSLYGYPKLITLGYGSLPFPSLSKFPANLLSSRTIFGYWIIGIYLLSAISLLVRFFLGLDDRKLHFRATLLLFGMILFRIALGRSDEAHIYDASSPAFLLAFLMLDDVVNGLRCHSENLLNGGRRVLGVAILLSLLLLIGGSSILRRNIFSIWGELTEITSKFTIRDAGVRLDQLPRGGIYYDPETAETLTKIGNALDRNTKPNEQVLFFPNDAAFYFLFDRKVPTRYVHAYFAASSAQRLEMVGELERQRPAIVVYNLTSWIIDGIPESVQVPEVVNYLREKYILVENMGNIMILKRRLIL
jgi:hypothetical protein